MDLFRSTPTKRLVLATLVNDAIILALLFGAAEVVLRRYAHSFDDRVTDAQLTGGAPRAVNPDGSRGKPMPPPAAASEERIIAAGDSVTFGEGISAENTWPAQLEEILAKRTAAPVHVANMGTPATDLRQIARWLREKSGPYHAQTVVLAATGNMISLGWIRRDDKPTLPPFETATSADARKPPGLTTRLKRVITNLHTRAAAQQFVEAGLYAIGLRDHLVDAHAPYGAMLANGWRQLDLDPAIAPEAWRLFERDLADVRAAAAERGLSLMVVGVVPRFRLSESYLDNQKRVPKDRLAIDFEPRLAQACAAAGVRFLGSSDVLLAERAAVERATGRYEPLYVPWDYTHLNAAGNAALASEIANALPAVESSPRAPASPAEPAPSPEPKP